MLYREFNRRIFDLYISRSSSTYAITSFDTEDLETIVPINQIKQFQLLQSDWPILLREEAGIPLYFGLIAIQSCAASMMEESGEVSANAYLHRLISLLGLRGSADLQLLFRQEAFGRPVQEQLWFHARRFLKARYNQDLDVPEPTENAGRFVQYPKSQSLLNTQDLKYFSLFFSETFRRDENLTFTFFEDQLNRHLHTIFLTPKIKRLLDDPKKGSLCRKQLYNHFNKWDGVVYDFRKRKPGQEQAVAGHQREDLKLLLLFEKGAPGFYLAPANTVVNSDELFQLTRYSYFHKSILVFAEIAEFDNEFEDSRFMYKDTSCYIVLAKGQLPGAEAYLLQTALAKRILENERMILFNYQVSDMSGLSPLRRLFEQQAPPTLSGGLKIGRNSYMHGFGPSISSDSSFSVICQHQPCDYQPQDAVPGEYILRVDGRKDSRFTIVATAPSTQVVASRQMGWDLSQLILADPFRIEGCMTTKATEISVPAIRTWIAMHTGRRPLSLKTDNVLFKALKNTVA